MQVHQRATNYSSSPNKFRNEKLEQATMALDAEFARLMVNRQGGGHIEQPALVH